jgi:hypothetical protein
MKCSKCDQEINGVMLNRFSHNGDDYWYCVPITEAEENAVIVDTDSNWTGYGLTEEEYHECIRCPHCDEFPFDGKEVQVYEVIRLVCFKEEAQNANQTQS